MSPEKRPYRKQQRAHLEAQTRLRITQAAMELHGSVGPARTSISAIAERAGVRRSTVYRHFPDDDALFDACSAHWAAANPLPDLQAWAAVADPEQRLRVALAELYAFYGRTDQMLANLLRDEATTPALQRTFGAFRAYLDAARDVLLDGRAERAGAVRAAVGHALAFPTWRSLVRDQGLADGDAVELMAGLAAAAERPHAKTTAVP
ncbi:MAG TPA: helix-turn-helix domain-containing protein [Capillimicrobium sp.]|nr:helix-turn-helix domain-containing protein [Capillimicrobium sp.]